MIRRLFLHALLLLAAVSASAQGVPFLETFTPEEYGGHCINFDIKTMQRGPFFIPLVSPVLPPPSAIQTITSGQAAITTSDALIANLMAS